jgi:UDP-2,3-diacylglucosamine hydrolase
MLTEISSLENKKIYFASDFHLGVPDPESSLIREKRIVSWLDSVRNDAHTIFLLGDIFDFWFEYKYTVPKGYIRLLGKIAELRDAGIPIIFFTGNHDMWMFDYFPKEFNIPVYTDSQVLKVGNQKLFIGHGDGLGPGDRTYKVIKRFLFTNRFAHWMFRWLHPNIGMWLAHQWSKSSRISNMKKDEQKFYGEAEFLWAYCKEVEKQTHHDFYIFGHRHLPLELEVAPGSKYINLGEWVNFNTFGVYDGTKVELKTFGVPTK